LCVLHSHCIYLNAVASIVTLSSTSICPFLVSLIATHWYVAIPDVSSFMGFPWRLFCPSDHGSLIKAYLSLLFICLKVCVLRIPAIVPTPIICLVLFMPIISSLRTCAWLRCTHYCPRATLLIFILCQLWITLSALPRPTPILCSIDRIAVSYLLLWCDCDLHCNLCWECGLSYSTWIQLALQLIMCIQPWCGFPYFGCRNSPLSLVGNSLSEIDLSECYSMWNLVMFLPCRPLC
jgi:hypothetical protein